MGLLVFLVVGGLVGYIASVIAGRNGSLGVIGSILVGWIGAGVANFFIADDVSLSQPTWGGFFAAIIGAVVTLMVFNFLTKD